MSDKNKTVEFQPASIDIWDSKYRLKKKNGEPVDKTVHDTYKRIARALAKIEKKEDEDKWYKEFLWALENGAIPAGRITSNAGAEHLKPATSLINCTVSGTIPDSMDGIMKLQHEAALTLKAGCVSHDTIVITEKGMVSAKQAVEEKHEFILSYNTKNKKFEKQKIKDHLIVNVKKENNIGIVSDNNVILETSKIHPVLVFRENELVYTEAENVIEGDFLVEYKLSPNLNISKSEALKAWFAGAHLGDGSAYVRQHHINKPKNWEKTIKEKGNRLIFKIRSAEKEVVEKYASFFRFFSNTNVKVVQNTTENGTSVWDYAVSSYKATEASEFFDNQIGKKSKNIKIPKWIKNNLEDYFIPFFAGVVDTDGTISKNGNYCAITSVSKNFTEKLKKFLSLFGVNSSISKSNPRSHVYKDKKIIGSGHYILKINDGDFLKIIDNFLISKKKKFRINLLNRNVGQYDNYYLTKELSNKLEAEMLNLSHKEKNELGYYNKKHKEEKVSRIYINKWINKFPNLKEDLLFTKQLVKVNKIEKELNIQEIFYDFKVDNNNNYLAGKNGFVVIHNCGIGYEFSTLRPKGAFVAGPGATTSGPLTFMDIYDAMCFTVASAGGRRGAQMGTFDISHPDVMDFIKAKHKDGRLRQFNLSLLITDQFLEAVKNDNDWPLVFPISKKEVEIDNIDLKDKEVIVWREWPTQKNYVTNEEGLVACKIYQKIKARNLWNMIMTSTYDYAEPGFILIDRVNEMNNNWFCENIRATNPCLTGDTLVHTPKGKVRLDEIKEGDEITTILGSGFVKTIEIHDNVDVYEVSFSNGVKLKATAAHIFHTKLNDEDDWDNNTRLDELQKEHHKVRIVSERGLDRGSVTIKDIKKIGKEKVYDLFEPKSDTWITEGIVSRGCGEQPLPPYGACLLGSINLTQFVKNPFTEKTEFDFEKYVKVVKIFARMLDNVVDINNLPLEGQRKEILRKRRHGMGFLGLGSTLTMLRMKYGSEKSYEFTEQIAKEMAIAGWEVGLDLAKEKGPAPIMDEDFEVTERMLSQRPEMKTDGYKIGDKVKGKILLIKYSYYMNKITKEISKEKREDMLKFGLRYTHHSSIAPTGTISLSLANNASNGIEPSFSHHYFRNIIKEGKKSKEQVDVFSYELLAYRVFVDETAMPFDKENPLPNYFTVSDEVTPEQHVKIQAAAQKWIDSSISKTANVPTDYNFENFKDIYMMAYEEGLKGCTTFRFNPEVFSGVLVKETDLENTLYRFELEDGSYVEAKGNQKVEYDGEIHNAANLFDALKEGYYGKF